MKDYESGFAEKVQPGDFFVGKSNYGYARAHAGVNITMKALGIGGIIADSFTLGYPQPVRQITPILWCSRAPGSSRR